VIIEQDLVYVDHEVPSLPDGWKVTTIEELISENGLFCDGDWVESKDQDPSGDVRLIQLADIGVGSYRDRSDRYLTSERASALSCSFLERGDILVARMPDPLGRACIFPGDKRRAVTVVDVAIVRPNNPEVSNRWLMHRINSMAFRNAVASLQSGSTRLRISRKNLARIAFPLPPLVEQLGAVEEIEKQLSRLDEAVANLQRVKANLKRYKASVLKAAVEGRLVEIEASIAQREGRSYETSEQLLQRILEGRRAKWKSKGKYKEPLSHDGQALPEIPEGWTWCSLDAASAETLIGLDRGRDHQREEAIGVRYVKMNNVSMDGEVQTDDLVYVDASSDEIARYELVNGDLLFNTRNSVELVGKVGIVRAVPARTVFNNNLMRIRTPDGVSPFFLGYQMCASGFRQRMEKVKKATTSVAAVYQKDLLPLAIALPPESEQIRIVAEIDRHLSIISEVQAEVDANLQRAQVMRQSLLNRAFSPCCTGVE